MAIRELGKINECAAEAIESVSRARLEFSFEVFRRAGFEEAEARARGHPAFRLATGERADRGSAARGGGRDLPGSRRGTEGQIERAASVDETRCFGRPQSCALWPATLLDRLAFSWQGGSQRNRPPARSPNRPPARSPLGISPR
jgi:hypothetical protein